MILHFFSRAAFFLLIFQAGAVDWPQWRGPNRNGHSPETGLRHEWPVAGPKLLWKTNGLGGGYSTPSVAGGRIYGLGYLGEEEIAWARNEKDGKPLWAVPLGGADKKMGYPDGTRSSPTVDGDMIYVLGAGGRLACLEAATGKIRWQKDYKTDFGGRMMSGWGFSESVLVDGEQLLCTPGGLQGTVVALNKNTGALFWQSRELTDKAAYASLLAVDIGGRHQYLVYTGESVAGLDAASGKVLWRATRPGKTAVIPTPIFHDNHVFVTSGYKIGCNLFKITPASGSFKAEQVYANNDLENHHGGVVLVGDYLYGYSDSRGWVCLEFKTGKVMWSERGIGKGSVTCADGQLYLRSERGTVALIDATPKGYKEKGIFEQPDRSKKNSWSHPVIANGRLYLRDQDILLCYDLKNR